MTQPKSVLEIHPFEDTPESISQVIDDLITLGDKTILEIGSQDKSKVTFESTIRALDDSSWHEKNITSRIYLLQNVSPDENIRRAAEVAMVKYQNWAIERSYDPKIYAVCKAYESQKKAPLETEDEKLFQETMRDFRRLGLDLPEEKQIKLKDLQKKLSQLETEFSSAINEYHDEIHVSKEELDGLDDLFLKGLSQTDDKKYKISLQYPEYLPVMEFCKNESIRKELYIKKLNTACNTNSTRLQQMVDLRQEIAGLLGYPSWNHFVIEERMARTPERVFHFLDDFEKRLRPKADKELKALKSLKAEETGQSMTDISSWDYYYYSSLYKKKFYNVDTKELREFFTLDQVLDGLFALIEKLFEIKMLEAPKGSFPTYHEQVRLFKVKDKHNAEIGAFYLDLFPRKGKYGHAAAFGIIDGKLKADGVYQRPVKAMVCNFSSEAPHLLSHSDVETLFHEFGHIFHGILTWAKHSRFAGTGVAWDFVEAPSQILENWAWQYDILKTIAKHYKDPSKTLSVELVAKMNEAQKAGMGMFYLRQLSFAKADLRVHGPGKKSDVVQVISDTVSQTFLPLPPNTAFAAGFGHMVGYASGYYGYAWADVIAADMFSLFKKAGLTNQELGLRLRKEIFESGGSRDENISLEKFLQRPLSYDAFFEGLGV